jgi:diacylglycerol kinase
MTDEAQARTHDAGWDASPLVRRLAERVGVMSHDSFAPEGAPARPPRSWRQKFADAFRGMKLGIRGQSSFFVHFFFAALVIAAAIALGVDLVSWCILLLCIGMVLVAEMINSALELLFRGLDERQKARCYRSLDIAAGAVLLASIATAVVGAIIFVNRLMVLFGGWDTGR